jgi:hypothetical protein
MIRVLLKPLSAMLPAGERKENARLMPGSGHDAGCLAGKRRSDAGFIDHGRRKVSPNIDGLVASLPSFPSWRRPGDSPGAELWFSPGSPGFIGARKVEILAALAGIAE